MQIALTLDVASISSISESNMVSAAPLLVILGDTLSSCVKTEQRPADPLHLEWPQVGRSPQPKTMEGSRKTPSEYWEENGLKVQEGRNQGAEWGR